MSDIVFIRGLEARTIIGINDWERENLQTVRLDIDVGCDVSKAANSTDIDETVNYRSVAKAVLAHVEAADYELVETMAENLAALILKDFAADYVRLRVSKPGAVRFSDEVGVEIVRPRGADGA